MTPTLTDTQPSPKVDRRKSPQRRAKEAAEDALAIGGNDFVEVMRLFDTAIGNDGAVIRAAIADKDWHRALASYLRNIKLGLDGKTAVSSYTRGKASKTNGGDQASSDTHVAGVATNDGGGHTRPDTQTKLAPSAELPESSLHGPSAADRAAGMRIGRRISNSLLDTYLVDGTPIRFCTKSECEGAARRRTKDAAFLLAISHALPLPEAVVGDYIDDQIADEAMQAAVKAAA